MPKLTMSPELAAMLSRPRQSLDPKRPTVRSYRLEKAANKRLAKSGFFVAKSDEEQALIAAEQRYKFRGVLDPNRGS